MTNPFYLSNIKKNNKKLETVTIGFKTNCSRIEVINLLKKGENLFLENEDQKIKGRILLDDKNDSLYIENSFRFSKNKEDFPFYYDLKFYKKITEKLSFLKKYIDKLLYKEYSLNLHSLERLDREEEVSLNEIVIKSNSNNDPIPKTSLDTWVEYKYFDFQKEKNNQVVFNFKRKINYIPSDSKKKHLSFVSGSREIDSFNYIKVRKKRIIPSLVEKLIEKFLFKNE